MKFVTGKLREVYDKTTTGRIQIVKDVDKNLEEDMFSIIGTRPISKSEKTADADDPNPVAVKSQKTEKGTNEPEKEEIEILTKPKEEELPTKKKSAENEPKKLTEIEVKEATENKAELEGVKPEAERRRVSELYLYLPKTKLTISIANSLINIVDFEFRANTPAPTMAVTKEADYYGYEWCRKNFEKEECFEYYYGYTWCLKQYDETECYNYYYE